jgi:lipid-A-disaccharide synthase
MKRVFLLAGEASGDLHGALLCRALRERRGDLEIHGVGGARMEESGVKLLLRSEDLAVVGLFEVLARAPRLLAGLSRVRRFFKEEPPDCFVPIDFPDFNFRLLGEAARAGIPILYYISPQVWAWRGGRIAVLRRYVRRMIVIFPFEEAIYREAGVPVVWVGHPLAETIAPAAAPASERARLGLAEEGPWIALLPGSRMSEVRRIGPLLGATRARIEEEREHAGLAKARFVLGLAPGLSPEAARCLSADRAGQASPLRTLDGIEALRACDLAMVASGTVTVEAALLGRPAVVVYRMNPLTYALARRMVRVEHIAMANLIAGRRLLPEYVQGAATPEALAAEAARLLGNPGLREAMQAGLLEVRRSLGPPGAAARAAEEVCSLLEEVPRRHPVARTRRPARSREGSWKPAR